MNVKAISTSRPWHRTGERAFTMVEIVLSIAIIAIAMVAILGVLPIGLRVQTDNEEESVISADAAIWMEAFRNGAQGMEYLVQDDASGEDFYIEEVMMERVVRRFSTGALISSNRTFLSGFTSASNLIGVLSRPKYEIDPLNDVVTNWNHYADVRALNGNMADLNADMDFAFKYRMIPELVPLLGVHPGHTVGANQAALPILEKNLFELRLHFQWPLVPGGQGGNYRSQARFNKGLNFRTQISGQQQVHVNGTANELAVGELLYFMGPRQYSYLSQATNSTP